MSRSKRVANAAPVELSPLIGGRLSPHVQLIQPFVFLFLVADVIPNCDLIPTNRGHEISACPEALPGIILLLLPIHPRQVNCALALMNPTTDDTEYFGGIEIIM